LNIRVPEELPFESVELVPDFARHSRQDNVLLVISQIVIPHEVELAGDEGGANEEQDGQGELENDQNPAEALAPGPGRRGSFQDFRRLKGGEE
jgi:hypothetical protein